MQTESSTSSSAPTPRTRLIRNCVLGLAVASTLLCVWLLQGALRAPQQDRLVTARGVATIRFASDRAAAPMNGAELPILSANPTGTGDTVDPASSIALTVVVTDEAENRIPGAIAALLYEDEKLPQLRALADEARAACADANGEVVFTCPRKAPPRGRPALTVRARGFGPARVTWEQLGLEEPTVVVLTRGLEIRGRVVHPSDAMRPLEGIELVCRGRGANTDAAAPTVFPGADIHIHRARSNAAGDFRFSGLTDGRYKVELASPGLIAWDGKRPLGNKPLIAGRKPLIVRAGTTGLRVMAVPLGVYAVEVRDRETGGFVQGTIVWPRFLSLPVIPLPNQGRFFSHIFVVGAAPIDLGTLESGRFAIPVVLPEYPLERPLAIELEVSAPGYHAKTVRVDCQSMLPAFWEHAPRIELEREGEWATVHCRVVDLKRVPIGPMSVPLRLLDSRTGDRILLMARVDADGWARGIAVPAGQWMAHVNWPDSDAGSAGTAFVTAPRGTTEVSVVMGAVASLRVDVRAPSGEAVDDVGLRIGRGEGPVRSEVVRTESQIRVYGDWLIPPGRGRFRNRAWPISEPGVWTVEAHHHVHGIVRKTIELSRGEVEHVELRFPPK